MKIFIVIYSGSRRFFDMYIPDPGIAQICGVFKKHDITPQIFDLNLQSISFSKFIRCVEEEKPDIVTFKFYDTGFRGVIHLAEIIRDRLPNCCLVAVGPHVSLFREHIFHQTTIFDFLLIGEGEIASIDLIEYLKGNKPIEEITNAIYLSNREIIHNEISFVENLDQLPFPDWKPLKLNQYFPIILLNNHRGCNHLCSFCAHNYIWGYKKTESTCDLPYKPSIRQKSLKRLCAETEYAVNQLGVRLFGFVDSIPFTNRLIDWAQFIINNNLKIYWTSFAMVNQFNNKELNILKKSGCVSLWIGIESGDQELRKKMGKSFSNDEIKLNIALIKQNDIIPISGFIVGFPGETLETLQKTKSLMEDLKCKNYVISPFILDPGSPISLHPHCFGIDLSHDWECKIVLRDELNEFEIPYYTINGFTNNQFWQQFEELSGYKGWDADRTIAESEYASILAKSLNISMVEFVNRATNSISSPESSSMLMLLKDLWNSTTNFEGGKE